MSPSLQHGNSVATVTIFFEELFLRREQRHDDIFRSLFEYAYKVTCRYVCLFSHGYEFFIEFVSIYRMKLSSRDRGTRV